MPTNVDTLVNLLTALAQRQQTVQQLATQLQASTVWRSPDGQLAVALTDAQQAELTAFIKAYLDESEVLIAAARAMLAPPPEADAGGGR